MMKSFRFIIVTAVSALPSVAGAQTGLVTLTGFVTDRNGSPIPLVDVSTTLGGQSRTDADGSFSITYAWKDTVTLVVRRVGYSPVIKQLVIERGVTSVQLSVKLAEIAHDIAPAIINGKQVDPVLNKIG
ncbi:MAG TPA: carboxypeptidase regulatory-like domain-containing protein, partial [Gemmatimonadaceae bacterium]